MIKWKGLREFQCQNDVTGAVQLVRTIVNENNSTVRLRYEACDDTVGVKYFIYLKRHTVVALKIFSFLT